MLMKHARGAGGSRARRKYTLPIVQDGRLGAFLEERALTSSPYAYKYDAVLQPISQARGVTAPLAIIAIPHDALDSTDPDTGRTSGSLADSTGSTPMYYRISNGTSITGFSGMTNPVQLDSGNSPNPAGVNTSMISTVVLQGTNTIPGQGMGPPNLVPYSVTVTSQDTGGTQVIDGGLGTGDGVAAVQVIGDYLSQQTVQASGPVNWADPQLGPAVTSESRSTTDTNPDGTLKLLAWSISGDSTSGVQKYVTDAITANYTPSNAPPGTLSSNSGALLNIVSSEGSVVGTNGGLAVTFLPAGASSSVTTSTLGSTTSTTVTFVRPFSSAASPSVETAVTMGFNAFLVVNTGPTTANNPTGMSGAQESFAWTFTSSVS